MQTINIEEAAAHLSRLVDEAANGEPFLISKAGKPLVQVSRIDESRPLRRTGFLPGVQVPDNFKEIGREEIEEMFYGKP